MSQPSERVAAELVGILTASGLSYDQQVKAISMARVAIQPRTGQGEKFAGPIEKPKEKKKAAKEKVA